MGLSEKEDDSSGINGNRRNKKNSGTTSPFLVKTHRMVEEGETDDVISWAETGKSFVVWKPMEFARDLLPAHFKHNNFSSFIRQLNTYGFRKVMPDRWEFANDKFQRGEQRLLNDICRRKSSSKSKLNKLNATDPLPSTSNSVSSSTSSPLLNQNLSDENKKLKRDNRILSAEILQAKKHCEGLLSFLSKNVNVKELNVGLLMKEAAQIGVEIGKEDYDNRGEYEEGEKVACLKLFGVIMKDFEGENQKLMKMGFRAPWVSRKICN